eukprot:1137638-Pelagomonas_calceolata.AAC.2
MADPFNAFSYIFLRERRKRSSLLAAREGAAAWLQSLRICMYRCRLGWRLLHHKLHDTVAHQLHYWRGSCTQRLFLALAVQLGPHHLTTARAAVAGAAAGVAASRWAAHGAVAGLLRYTWCAGCSAVICMGWDFAAAAQGRSTAAGRGRMPAAAAERAAGSLVTTQAAAAAAGVAVAAAGAVADVAAAAAGMTVAMVAEAGCGGESCYCWWW